MGHSTVSAGPKKGSTGRLTTHLRPSTGAQTTMGIPVWHGWAGGTQTTLCPRPEALTEPTKDNVAARSAPSPRGNSFPTSFLSGDFPFPGTLAGSLGPTPGAPLLSRLTFRSPLYIVCASFSPGRPQNLSPEFLPCPRPLLAAVGDAVPSARQCPRPWLALYETLSRARAAGLHPSFQPRS